MRLREFAHHLVGCFAVLGASQAHAQIAGAVTVQSQYLVRGYSVSAGKPTALEELSYDAEQGWYVSAATLEDLNTGTRPAFLGGIAAAGYARRMTSSLSLDGGVVRTQYAQQDGAPAQTGYTEAHLGLLGRALSVQLYYSPDYLRGGDQDLYGEVRLRRRLWGNVGLDAELGYLAYVAERRDQPRRHDQYDWQLSASRPVAAFTPFLAVSGGGPGRDVYRGKIQSKTVVSGGVGLSF